MSINSNGIQPSSRRAGSRPGRWRMIAGAATVVLFVPALGACGADESSGDRSPDVSTTVVSSTDGDANCVVIPKADPCAHTGD